MSRPTAESGFPRDPSAPPPARRERLVWIDLFRGAAVLIMIETHVVNTFMVNSLRADGWFTVLNYINGLVAPSFLFIAGFVQGMERGASPDKPVKFARRAGHLLGILFLAYALHFPWTELGQHRWDDAVRVGSQADVLQCISASLLLLLGVTWLAQKIGGRRGQSVWWCVLTALLLAVVFLAPYAPGWNGLPVPLQAWVNRSTGSWFPLFSWAGFVLFGAMTGAAYGLARRTVETADLIPQPVAGSTLSLMSLVRRSSSVFLITPVPLAVSAWAFRDAAYSPVSPSSFFERAAWVLILAACCEWLAGRLRPSLPLFAGKHSLTLYVTHLVLISTLVGAGLSMNTISLAGVLALIAGVATVSLALTWVIVNARAFVRSARGSVK
ncbi:MAG: heparan-alpha-glucosaminide N-acetyltransferase domain-containing protein [Chthoniobacter sp.]|uniref:heparan-alpha-glucosaminide N-acetyltransferase domain-containing protein n=1 Tax=Chthoniobacter sp. TaxID=2510640 RepID=UPI0032AB4D9B